MTEGERPPDGHDDGIDPALVSAIEEIEEELLDKGDGNLALHVFTEYYNNLPEIDPEDIKGSLIDFEPDAEGTIHLTPIAPTQFGQLCEATKTAEGAEPMKELLILCGSLVITGQYEEMNDDERNTLGYLVHNAETDASFIPFSDTRFGVYTKGLCQDAYFIFLRVTPLDTFKPKYPAVDSGYSTVERVMILSVQPYLSDEPMQLVVSNEVIVSDNKINTFTVFQRKEDEIIEHYIA